MAAELIFGPDVEQDIGEAYDWPEARRVGKGEDFPRSLDACIRAIRRMPEMHRVIYKDYRRALIRKFPHAVLYESSADAVTIHGVFHSSRDPEQWRGRLP